MMSVFAIGIAYLCVGLILGISHFKWNEYNCGKSGSSDDFWVATTCIFAWPIYLVVLTVCLAYAALSKYVLDNLPLYVARTNLFRFGTHLHKHDDITTSLKNFLESSGDKTTREDVENFLKIDGWRKVVSQGDLYTKFVCKNSLYKQREG